MSSQAHDRQRIEQWLGAKGYPNSDEPVWLEADGENPSGWQVEVRDRSGQRVTLLGGYGCSPDELRQEIGALPQGQG